MRLLVSYSAPEYGETGRAGLVGTNSIRQGWSRTAALDYIEQHGGHIHEAISTQVWSGQAKVHVSIVNWIKQKPTTYYLDNRKVNKINSSLTSEISVSEAARISSNQNKCFQGVTPRGEGFIITEQQAQDWITLNPNNQEVLKPLLDAATLTRNATSIPKRWIIDFQNMSFEDANDYKLILDYVRINVKPQREQTNDIQAITYWWQFWRSRSEMREVISSLSIYFCIPRHSKWFVFSPAQAIWLPGDSTTIVASEDFYILGILTSNVHRTWVKAQSSTLKGDTRYTHNTCFETFPFPQIPNPKLIEQIRSTALELHEYRSQQMEKKQWGITKLYNEYFAEPTSQLFKLHAKLDRLVLQAYSFNPNDDLLEKLLTLNLELAAKEKSREAIVGCWAPEQ